MKKKWIVSIIAVVLLVSILQTLAIPLVSAEHAKSFAPEVNNGLGGSFVLDPTFFNTGGVTITADTKIDGMGATIDLQGSTIEVVGCNLIIANCIITNGTSGITFRDAATGLVKQNRLVYNDVGITIENCMISINIINNIITLNEHDGMNIVDSTNIMITRNTISNNDGTAIDIDNQALYLTGPPGPDANIEIGTGKKSGNKLLNNEYGIEADYVNGLSIRNNLLYGTDGYGLYLDRCPVVVIQSNAIIATYDEAISVWGDSSLSPSAVSCIITFS